MSASGDHVDNVTQIQLRFCVRDTSYRQSDKFPSRVVVKVNNEMVQLPVSFTFFLLLSFIAVTLFSLE